MTDEGSLEDPTEARLLPASLEGAFPTKVALYAAIIAFTHRTQHDAKPDAKTNNKTRVAYVCAADPECEVGDQSFCCALRSTHAAPPASFASMPAPAARDGA
jgi:hypothetical protein